MPATIDATVGGPVANSYETLADAQLYFDTRLSVAGWDNAADQSVLLIMGTRTLDALAQPFRTLFPPQGGSPAYYRIRRRWRGSAATPTQRLSWPRIGLLDHNGNPIDVAIVGNTVANPTIVETALPHNQVTGASVLIFGDTSSVPSINGTWTATVIDSTHLSIALAVTVAGIGGGGRLTYIPQPLKDALAELAGQLGNSDRTLDNDVAVQGITSIKAGSVALGFKQAILPQVIPDAVYNLMPIGWLTEERFEMALRAEFDMSPGSRHESEDWR